MSLRELSVRVEGLFLDGACQDILVLGPYESGSLAWLNVLEIKNDMWIAVDLKCNTFSEITCINQ